MGLFRGYLRAVLGVVWCPFLGLFKVYLRGCLRVVSEVVWQSFQGLFKVRFRGCLKAISEVVWGPFQRLFEGRFRDCLRAVSAVIWVLVQIYLRAVPGLFEGNCRGCFRAVSGDVLEQCHGVIWELSQWYFEDRFRVVWVPFPRKFECDFWIFFSTVSEVTWGLF